MISIKIPQKGRKKNFSRELQKDKSFQMLSPAIHLEGWDKHFEHEYIIKPSKNLTLILQRQKHMYKQLKLFRHLINAWLHFMKIMNFL